MYTRDSTTVVSEHFILITCIAVFNSFNVARTDFCETAHEVKHLNYPLRYLVKCGENCASFLVQLRRIYN
jgi:hypothetical protein